MANRINPFHNLYLSEAIGADRFVHLFSPLFVDHATALFQPGHVVLQGLQGSGKTMLLNLLKPDTRIAYYRSGQAFPVKGLLGKFIGTGINLRKAGLIEFGQLVLPESTSRDLTTLALQYGDFLNYWVIADLLGTLQKFAAEDRELRTQLGLSLDTKKLDHLARHLSQETCFFGYLDSCNDYAALVDRVRERILTYRKYINMNLKDGLPNEVQTTVSVIGEPISRLSGALKDIGILDRDTEVYVRVDQYEQLATLNTGESSFGDFCRDVTHKLLASRDTRVSYRFGTRQYAWPETPKIFGTQDVLEHKRDYSIVDIDDKLRRKENVRTWIFPEFAKDIFRRRLGQTPYAGSVNDKEPLQQVFGASMLPRDRAKRYVQGADARKRIHRPESDTPPEWKVFIETLAEIDPLEARFGEAWVRQRGVDKRALRENPPAIGSKYPWSKEYWVKERNEQACLQLASSNRQQLIWSGEDDLLHLAGGNILVFLFLCQHIWDAWLRDMRSEPDVSDVALPCIDDPVQSQGIREASEEWSRKVKEGAKAKKRGQFLHMLGQLFYRTLTDDVAMSNPGSNGFSVSLDELENTPDVRSFLQLCAEYGDLYDAPHTSKVKGEMRRKFYLAPVLSPRFKIPYQKNKEPIYVSVYQIASWISGKGGSPESYLPNRQQLGIFDEPGA